MHSAYEISEQVLSLHNSPKGAYNNEELWQQLREGSRSAIEDLYRYNYQILYSYAFKICRDKDLCKDCLQELFAGLWEKRDHLSEVSKVRPYLLQSIWHLVIKKLKKNNKYIALDENAHYDIEMVFSRENEMVQRQEGEDKSKMLKEAFCELSTRQKQILFMQYYEGLTIDEIQQITELKYQSIKNITYRAMLKMRDFFKI